MCLVSYLGVECLVDFTHYTHGTGQVRSNSSIQKPWQLREFKTDISAKGKVIFVADTVKSNPLTRLFVNKGDLPVIWNMGPYSPTDFLVDFLVVLTHLLCSFFLFLAKNLLVQNTLSCLYWSLG
jgi:hypothetical protein